MSELIKNRVFIIIVLLLSIFLVSVGVTHTWISWNDSDDATMTMQIGEYATITFDEGNSINADNLTPVSNYLDGESISFSITNNDNTSDTIFHYSVYLDITTIVGELKNSIFKYILLDGSNNIIDEGNFSKTSNNTTLVVTSGKVLPHGTTSYTFIIYIDGNKQNNSNNVNNSFKGKLRVVVNRGQIATAYITNMYMSAIKTEYTDYNIAYNYAPSVNLMNDRFGSMDISIDAGNIRYYGGDPNNYVLFNDELWRIIGVFNGKLKIIRNESIGDFSWNTSFADINNLNGIDQRITTIYPINDLIYVGSDLMKLLNPGYGNNTDKTCKTIIDSNGNCGDNFDTNYENILVNNSLYWNGELGKCYYRNNYGVKNCDFTKIGLSDEAKKMIDEVTWDLDLRGSSEVILNDKITASTLYSFEHLNASGILCTTNSSECSTDIVGITNWIGKVGLMSSSDYVYATGGGEKGINACLSSGPGFVGRGISVENWYHDCITNNWLYYGENQWMISSFVDYRNIAIGFELENSYVFENYSVRPVVYLSANTIISRGTGTIDVPYVLK